MVAKYRVLILCHQPSQQLNTSALYLNALKNHLDAEVVIMDVYGRDLDAEQDLNSFHAIIIHYSTIIVSDTYLSPLSRNALHEFKGVKVCIIQDEYRWVNQTVSCMQFLEFDLLLTCVPDVYIESLYPKAKLPNVKKINVLTGYVSEQMLTYKNIGFHERSIDVLYRAHKLSAWYGKIAQDKWEIAAKFNEHAKNINLITDVSYESRDRIYGENWIDFLLNGKCALGVESGASVFDFDDTIRKSVENFEKHNPHANFEEIEAKYFPGLDGKIELNQISPRIFEYAACRNMMILYEGEYSGIIQSHKHYLPLKKDFSNFNQIAALIKDEGCWQELTTNAYNDLILSKKYSYHSYAKFLDSEIKALFAQKRVASSLMGVKLQKSEQYNRALFNFVYRHIGRFRAIGKKIYNSFQDMVSYIRVIKLIKADKLRQKHDGTLCMDLENSMHIKSQKFMGFKICSTCLWAFRGYRI